LFDVCLGYMLDAQSSYDTVCQMMVPDVQRKETFERFLLICGRCQVAASTKDFVYYQITLMLVLLFLRRRLYVTYLVYCWFTLC